MLAWWLERLGHVLEMGGCLSPSPFPSVPCGVLASESSLFSGRGKELEGSPGGGVPTRRLQIHRMRDERRALESDWMLSPGEHKRGQSAPGSAQLRVVAVSASVLCW